MSASSHLVHLARLEAERDDFARDAAFRLDWARRAEASAKRLARRLATLQQETAEAAELSEKTFSVLHADFERVASALGALSIREASERERAERAERWGTSLSDLLSAADESVQFERKRAEEAEKTVSSFLYLFTLIGKKGTK